MEQTEGQHGQCDLQRHAGWPLWPLATAGLVNLLDSVTITTMKPQPHKTRRVVIGWPLAVGLCVVLAGDARAQGSVEADRAALEALYRAAGGGTAGPTTPTGSAVRRSATGTAWR
jgi:hypothetical protein